MVGAGASDEGRCATDVFFPCRQVAVYRRLRLFRLSSLQLRWHGRLGWQASVAVPQRVARRADQRRRVLAQESAEGALRQARVDLVAAPPGRAERPQQQALAAAVAEPLAAPVAGTAALPVLRVPPVARLVAHVERSRGVSAPVALRQVRAGLPVRAEPPVQVAPLCRLLPLAREHGRAVPPVLLTARAQPVAAPVAAAPGPAGSAQSTLAVRRVGRARYCRYAVPLALALTVTVALWPRPVQPVVLQPVDRRPLRTCCRALLLPGQALSVHVQRVAAVPQVARPAVALAALRAPVPLACHAARGRGCRDWLT